MKNLNKLILLGVVLMISTTSLAQEYKFGKVSKEELLEKAYPQDSSANAAVLYEKRKVYFDYNQSFGFRVITEVHKRVKFYNKNGFNYASEQVFLYKIPAAEEKVNSIKGITYNLVDGKVIETKLKKEGVFRNEHSENYNQIKFTMPTVKEGSVVEFKYKIESPFVHNIDKIYLQQDIPIKKIDIKVATPEYYNFKKFTTGYLPINLKESKGNGKMNYNVKARNKSVTQQGNTKFYTGGIDYKVNTYVVNSSNIPAFKREPYSGNPDNYRSSIVFELEFEKFPNRPLKTYTSSWDAVAKSIFDHPRFGNELKKNGYYQQDVDQLLEGITDPMQKTILIYDFVKKKMAWNNWYSRLTAGGVKKAYKEGVGNVAEINIMLTSMLQYAGISAKPVLVSSTNKTISLFPTLKGFDYVVSRVKVGDNIIYLDATDKYGEPNVLPSRVIHGSGRVIAENGTSQLINFRPNHLSRIHSSVLCEIDADGLIKGKQSTNRSSYLAHNFRVRHAAKKQEEQIERVTESYGVATLNEYELKGVNDIGKSISERFEFTVNDEVEVIDNEMFFSPLLFLKNEENIFKSNERKYPVDYGYGYSSSMMVSVKIPEGYEISEIPEGSAFKLPENMGSFVYRSSVMGNTIQVSITETLNTPFIPADYYPVLKQFYNQIIQKESDQVVLKKI